MNELIKLRAALADAEMEGRIAYAKGTQDAANKLRGIMPHALEQAYDEGVKSLAEFLNSIDQSPEQQGKITDAIKSLIYGKKLKDIEDQFERKSAGGPSGETTDSAPGQQPVPADDQPWLRVRGLHDPVPGDEA